jgi:hypothetical protein
MLAISASTTFQRFSLLTEKLQTSSTLINFEATNIIQKVSLDRECRSAVNMLEWVVITFERSLFCFETVLGDQKMQFELLLPGPKSARRSESSLERSRQKTRK